MINIKTKVIFLLPIILILSLFSSNIVYWNSCEYKWQIDRCMKAQNGSINSIEDFVCIPWNIDEITYQIILDMEFKKVDEKMDKYLEDLETNKNTYFWQWAKKTYVDWINDIHEKWDEFKKEFLWLCWDSIMKKAISCSKFQKPTNSNSKEYFTNEWTSCKKLVDKKIELYLDVAFSVLMLNKQQTNADDKKLYDQWQRSNYDHLLEIMMINIWYVERIWQKWPSKLANPH